MKGLKDFFPQNWKQILGWLILAATTTTATRLGWAPPTPTPPPPMPIWEDKFGWVPDPEAVLEVIDKLQFHGFQDTPAGKSNDPLPAKVYLWDAVRKIDPRGPPTKDQANIGSCVSFGTNNAIYRTMAVQIALFNAAEELHDIAEEVTYGGSRVEVGKGRIRGDGSVGAWAAAFCKDWGVVSRAVHGSYDLSKYDVSRCRTFGNQGVPDDLEAVARQHPVKAIALVKTWADAKKSLASGYGIAICSNQGFNRVRDSRGVCRASGSWAHCMCLDGYHVEDGKEFGHIDNSWGPTAHSGPVGWGNPSTSGFWAESAVVERMLRAGDSWAFSAVIGFPSRKIDWFVLKVPQHEDSPSILVRGAGSNGREIFHAIPHLCLPGAATCPVGGSRGARFRPCQSFCLAPA